VHCYANTGPVRPGLLEQYIFYDTALIVEHHPDMGIASWLKWYHQFRLFTLVTNQGFNRSSFDHEHNCYCHKQKLITTTLLLTFLNLSVKGAGIT